MRAIGAGDLCHNLVTDLETAEQELSYHLHRREPMEEMSHPCKSTGENPHSCKPMEEIPHTCKSMAEIPHTFQSAGELDGTWGPRADPGDTCEGGVDPELEGMSREEMREELKRMREELKRMREEVKEHKRYKDEAEFQRNILKCTGQAIICTNLSGVIIYWNKAATEVYGWEEKEAMGKHIFEILPASDPVVEESGVAILQELAKGNTIRGEYSMFRKNGEVVTVVFSNTPVMDEHGTLVGTIGCSTDICELNRKEMEILRLNAELELRVAERTKQLEESNLRLKVEINDHLLAKKKLLAYARDLEASREMFLEQSRELKKMVDELQVSRIEAESANRLKSRFLASMSHEIRTPMNGVLGMTNLILSTELTEEQQQFVHTIQTSGDSLLAIIDDILDFSKIEAGELLLEHRSFSFMKCLEDTVDLLAVKALEKGIEVICYVDNSVPELAQTDPSRLRQVLVNLLSNALKFTEEGEILVRASAEPWSGEPPFYHDSTHTPPLHKLHVSVEDTGIGIHKEGMGRLFKPFSQIDASMTRRFGGTGLGLIISKQITEMLGGEMWVESKGLTCGSTFHFTVALYAPEYTSIRTHMQVERMQDSRDSTDLGESKLPRELRDSKSAQGLTDLTEDLNNSGGEKKLMNDSRDFRNLSDLKDFRESGKTMELEWNGERRQTKSFLEKKKPISGLNLGILKLVSQEGSEVGESGQNLRNLVEERLVTQDNMSIDEREEKINKSQIHNLEKALSLPSLTSKLVPASHLFNPYKPIDKTNTSQCISSQQIRSNSLPENPLESPSFSSSQHAEILQSNSISNFPKFSFLTGTEKKLGENLLVSTVENENSQKKRSSWENGKSWDKEKSWQEDNFQKENGKNNVFLMSGKPKSGEPHWKPLRNHQEREVEGGDEGGGERERGKNVSLMSGEEPAAKRISRGGSWVPAINSEVLNSMNLKPDCGTPLSQGIRAAPLELNPTLSSSSKNDFESLKGKKVLVVNDNQTMREILSLHLKGIGMEPFSAKGGKEALTLVSQNGNNQVFDIVIMDIQMPGLDGLTAARKIWQLPEGKKLPVILLCPYGGVNQVRHEGTGAVSVLSKPIRQSQLNFLLRNIFSENDADNSTVEKNNSRGDKRVRERSEGGGEIQEEVGGGGFRKGMGGQHPLRILLVEDNLVNQKVATQMLSRLTYFCDVVGNGQEALDAVEKNGYDLVLMDIQMPVMDGIEATHRILQKWGPEKRPRIIAMTANVLHSDRELCLGAGMDGFISKPIHVQDLISALEETSLLRQTSLER